MKSKLNIFVAFHILMLMHFSNVMAELPSSTSTSISKEIEIPRPCASSRNCAPPKPAPRHQRNNYGSNPGSQNKTQTLLCGSGRYCAPPKPAPRHQRNNYGPNPKPGDTGKSHQQSLNQANKNLSNYAWSVRHVPI